MELSTFESMIVVERMHGMIATTDTTQITMRWSLVLRNRQPFPAILVMTVRFKGTSHRSTGPTGKASLLMRFQSIAFLVHCQLTLGTRNYDESLVKIFVATDIASWLGHDRGRFSGWLPR
jgi:hypothetical protein